MAKPTIVSFGIPRSGTTLVKKWLENIPPYLCEFFRMAETSQLHPIHCPDGLEQIQRVYDDGQVLFIHVVRNIPDVFKSLYAARKAVQEQHAEVLPSPMPKLDGIANVTDERMFEMIEAHRANLDKQRENVTLLTVDYDSLGDSRIVAAIVDDIVRIMNTDHRDNLKTALIDWMRDHYMKKPVRGGKLSHGWSDVQIPISVIKRIEKEYGLHPH